MAHTNRPRLMYIECKADGLNGPARIGRVTVSNAHDEAHFGVIIPLPLHELDSRR